MMMSFNIISHRSVDAVQRKFIADNNFSLIRSPARGNAATGSGHGSYGDEARKGLISIIWLASFLPRTDILSYCIVIARDVIV